MEKYLRLMFLGLALMLIFGTEPGPSPDWRSAAAFLSGFFLALAVWPRLISTPKT